MSAALSAGAFTRIDCVPVSTCGEMKYTVGVQQHVAACVDDLDRRAHLDLVRVLRRNRDVDLESGALVDGGQHGGVGDAIADMYRDIADNAIGGSEDAVVLQLDLLGA